MAQEIKCVCGTMNDADSKYCKTCSLPLGLEWKKEKHQFAALIPPEKYRSDKDDHVIIPFGSKGLVFENSELVESIESGKYSFKKENFLTRLFSSSKKHSVFLSDAGDVSMEFKYTSMYTADDIPVDLGVEIEFRCDQSNLFFINIMKDSNTFELSQFRPIFWAQIKNALESVLKECPFDALKTDLQFKKELASNLETHLRVSFQRSGLDLIQVKSISFSQEDLDAMKKRAVQQKFRKEDIKQDREDFGIDIDQADLNIDRTRTLGEKGVDHDLVKAQLLNKRVTVLKSIQEAEISQIKTKEDFRKFQQEIDREQVLDKAEWDEFEREILWKEDDQKRDRNFLVQKIELQQSHDLRRIELLNNTELTTEEKKNQYKILDLELTEELALQLKKINGMAQIQMAEVQAKAQTQRVSQLTSKQTEIEVKLQDLEFEKEKARQDIDQSVDKGKAQHELKKLDLEYEKLELDFAMAIREKKDALELKKKAEHDTLELKRKNAELDMALKEKAVVHQQTLEVKTTDAKIETDRMQVLAGLNIEQLIAVSGQSQSAILGDLAQSQSLKGQSADEIMAMKDPVAFKEALVERAKNANNDDIKVFYERIIGLTETSSEKVANAYKESADRAERMAANQQSTISESYRALAGQNNAMDDMRQNDSEAKERIFDRSMDRMADVATGKPGSKSTEPSRVVNKIVCRNCKQTIDANSNACKNCGEKLY